MILDQPRAAEYPGDPRDEYKFIYDSWANSFRKSPWAGCVPNHLYDQVSREAARSILDRGAVVLVAVTPIAGQEEQFPEVRRVMGYSVSEPDRNVLHWLYVKDDFRGMGVGRELLEKTCRIDEDWTYTFRTRASSKFLGPRFRWDPVRARVK